MMRHKSSAFMTELASYVVDKFEFLFLLMNLAFCCFTLRPDFRRGRGFAGFRLMPILFAISVTSFRAARCSFLRDGLTGFSKTVFQMIRTSGFLEELMSPNCALSRENIWSLKPAS